MTSGERRPLPGSDHRSRYQWGACATSRGRQQPGHKMFQAMTRPGLLGARDPVLGCLFGFFFRLSIGQIYHKIAAMIWSAASLTKPLPFQAPATKSIPSPRDDLCKKAMRHSHGSDG